MRLLILVQSGSLAGRRSELETGLLAIGRGDDCQLKFDVNERLVSKRHAVIERQFDGFYLTDASSTNGTFVNGERVARHKLNSNDVIQCGAGGPQIAVTIEPSDFRSAAPAPVVSALPNPSFSAPSTPPTTPPLTAQPPAMRQSAPVNPPVYQQPPPFGQDEKPEPASSIGQSFANLGLYNPVQNPPRPAAATATSNNIIYIAAAIAVVIMVFLGLLVSIFTVMQLGLVASFIAAIVAFLPAIFYVLPLLWLDRYDPEPPFALALSFAWGALVAIFVSLIANTIIASIFGPTVGAIASAPIFEEASKGAGVLLLLVFWRKEFDGIVDGIVYAGVIALGFATVENVLYYGRMLNTQGSQGLLILFVLRGILSPFAHVIFTAMIGIGCGISRETHNKFLRIIMPLVGYLAAVALHAFWNTLASLGGLGFFLIGYVIFEIPFFIIFVGFIIYMTRRENKILKQTLGVEVAKGTITSEQMETATSAFRSLGWSLGGIGNGKIWARRKFLRAVAKLGLAWWHISRANAAGGETRSLGQLPLLEGEVKRWQAKI